MLLASPHIASPCLAGWTTLQPGMSLPTNVRQFSEHLVRPMCTNEHASRHLLFCLCTALCSWLKGPSCTMMEVELDAQQAATAWARGLRALALKASSQPEWLRLLRKPVAAHQSNKIVLAQAWLPLETAQTNRGGARVNRIATSPMCAESLGLGAGNRAEGH
jgi:hypothetical protein